MVDEIFRVILFDRLCVCLLLILYCFVRGQHNNNDDQLELPMHQRPNFD